MSGRTFDQYGLLNTCKLSDCKWARVLAPVMKNLDTPSFMLTEPEEVEGFFGDSFGSSAGVVELTGVFRRSGCSAAQGDMAIDASEVVCLCYRLKINHTDLSFPMSSELSAEEGAEIEGYIDWCARGTRSRLSGFITPQGSFQFTIVSGSAAILGPPDSMAWLQSLSFQGVVTEGRLLGTYTLSASVRTLPHLKPGEARIDRFAIADKVRGSSGIRDRVPLLNSYQYSVMAC
jgi:hypothetical protein